MKLFRVSTVPVSLNILLRGQLRFLNRFFKVSGISTKGSELVEVQEREGIDIFEVNMERKISPIKDFISLCRLFFLFRKEKPQIVHSITPKAGLLSMLAAKFSGVPIRMHTFTGLIFPTRTGSIQKLLIKMDQLLCWSATNIYPEGEGVKNDLLKYKITNKPLKIIANGNVNGIDLNLFCKSKIYEKTGIMLKKQLGIQNKDFVFIFVGRLVGDKGINELIKAYCKVNDENSKLLLVGPFENELDPLLPETSERIKENKNIISVGFQKDVISYFAISNSLVFPSYREGFPNVVMQAGAMELPCIVTDINGSNEIIEENINGTIVPVKDSEALYQAMIKMMNNKKYYEILKSNARQMIESRYEQSVVWTALLEEYNDLLKSRNI